MSEHRERQQSACNGCTVAYQAINGLYCPQRKCYVEYAAQRPCQK